MEKPEKYQRQRAKKRIYVDSNTGPHLAEDKIEILVLNRFLCRAVQMPRM